MSKTFATMIAATVVFATCVGPVANMARPPNASADTIFHF